MNTLLRKLHTESFVLNLRNAISSAPVLPGYKIQMTDNHTIEVETSKEQNLNEVFTALSAQGIAVVSMRNKSNRLEELFLSMVERGNEAGKKAS